MEGLITKADENTAEDLVATGSKRDTTPVINAEDLNQNQEQGGENTPETQTSGGPAVTPEDVLCDSCIESPRRAHRSCLTCLVSYCEAHLRPHLENQKFQNHRLVEPLQDIESRTCQEHRLPLELYCLTDGCGVCVCRECEVEEHPGHRTVPVGKARQQVETELQKKQGEILKTVTSVENAIGKLQSNTTSIESSVAGARAVMEQQFYLLQGAIEEARRGATEVLEDEQRQAISQAEGIQAHLEQKSQDLKKTLDRAGRLSRNKTDVDYLQEYSEWKRGVVDVCLPGLYIGLTERMASFSRLLTESTRVLCDQLKATYTDKLKDICKTDKPGIKTTVQAKRPSPLPEPETRDDFLQYASSSLTFDPNTVHKFLRLTKDNRKVTNTAPWQHNYADAPERFESWRQAMAQESMYLGRHYFEVELSGEGAYVGLTYRSLDRKGAESGSCITGNDFSWCLGREGRSFSVWHADVEMAVEAAGGFSRHAVYIDFDSGVLAFYGVEDGAVLTLLHRYDAEFKEPLLPTVWLPKKDSVVLLVSPKDSFPNGTRTPTPPMEAIVQNNPEP
ncbi:hypothetical protein DPEC_G00308320 [Dallia pectoralis]|uniref:Uncharacterized protein n=1 Tax=Dallia pectoralis TaxID=75939 RepID=A0ACC2FEM4_DALPE|nr:hypothetical protein DPEC_G00308320 [Dallia pectoralis]